MRIRSLMRSLAAAVTVLFAMCLLASLAPAAYTQAAPPPPKKHLNFIQRHPTMTGIAAGVATHHMLKKAAARDKAEGKRLNFAERHPTLTAIGAGVVTHHIIKKHTPK